MMRNFTFLISCLALLSIVKCAPHHKGVPHTYEVHLNVDEDIGEDLAPTTERLGIVEILSPILEDLQDETETNEYQTESPHTERYDEETLDTSGRYRRDIEAGTQPEDINAAQVSSTPVPTSSSQAPPPSDVNNNTQPIPVPVPMRPPFSPPVIPIILNPVPTGRPYDLVPAFPPIVLQPVIAVERGSQFPYFQTPGIPAPQATRASILDWFLRSTNQETAPSQRTNEDEETLKQRRSLGQSQTVIEHHDDDDRENKDPTCFNFSELFDFDNWNFPRLPTLSLPSFVLLNTKGIDSSVNNPKAMPLYAFTHTEAVLDDIELKLDELEKAL